MSPQLRDTDKSAWDHLETLARSGFEWTARAEEQRSLEVGIPRRSPAEEFINEIIRARGSDGAVGRTKWGPKDPYPNQINYEIRARLDEDVKVYVKLSVVERKRGRQTEELLLITSFKKA